MAYLVRHLGDCRAPKRVDPHPLEGVPGSGIGSRRYTCRCGVPVVAMVLRGTTFGIAIEGWD